MLYEINYKLFFTFHMLTSSIHLSHVRDKLWLTANPSRKSLNFYGQKTLIWKWKKNIFSGFRRYIYLFSRGKVSYTWSGSLILYMIHVSCTGWKKSNRSKPDRPSWTQIDPNKTKIYVYTIFLKIVQFKWFGLIRC